MPCAYASCCCLDPHIFQQAPARRDDIRSASTSDAEQQAARDARAPRGDAFEDATYRPGSARATADRLDCALAGELPCQTKGRGRGDRLMLIGRWIPRENILMTGTAPRPPFSPLTNRQSKITAVAGHGACVGRTSDDGLAEDHTDTRGWIPGPPDWKTHAPRALS